MLRLIYDNYAIMQEQRPRGSISALDYKYTLTHTATLPSMTEGHLNTSQIELKKSCLLITGLKVSIFVFTGVINSTQEETKHLGDDRQNGSQGF